jgi:ABC-type tungstate transport system substrate-binding protein
MLSAMALGCGPAGNQTISLGNADVGRTVVVGVGDTIELTLQTIGPGRYGTPTVSSGSIAYLGESPAGPPNPGGTRQLYRFEAVVLGRADIRIPHSGGVTEPANREFTVTVDVQ